MTDLIHNLFTVLGGVGVLVILIQFISKEIIKTWLQKDLESHKSELKKESDKEIEILKSKNEIILSEFKEKVVNLSKRRIEAIESVSSKLIEVWVSIENATQLLRPVSDEPKHLRSQREVDFVIDSSNNFLIVFKSVEIFFPTALSTSMLEFNQKTGVACNIWGSLLCSPSTPNMFNKTYDDFRNNLVGLKPRFEEIRLELRKLIGVE